MTMHFMIGDTQGELVKFSGDDVAKIGTAIRFEKDRLKERRGQFIADKVTDVLPPEQQAARDALSAQIRGLDEAEDRLKAAWQVAKEAEDEPFAGLLVDVKSGVLELLPHDAKLKTLEGSELGILDALKRVNAERNTDSRADR